MTAHTIARNVSERDFQDAIVELANLLGWKVFHARNSRTASGGHLTAVAYQGKGFPDLLMCRERVIAVEVKPERGRLRDDQLAWIDDLAAAGVEAYCWRPSDWPHVERILRRQGGHGG